MMDHIIDPTRTISTENTIEVFYDRWILQSIPPKSRNSSFRPALLDRTIFSRHSEENSTTPCWVPRCRRLWRGHRCIFERGVQVSE